MKYWHMKYSFGASGSCLETWGLVAPKGLYHNNSVLKNQDENISGFAFALVYRFVKGSNLLPRFQTKRDDSYGL